MTRELVNRFRGINLMLSNPNLGPEWASDSLNFIPQPGGSLSKLRAPQLLGLSAVIPAGTGNVFGFQRADGIRQIVVQGDQPQNAVIALDQNNGMDGIIIDSDSIAGKGAMDAVTSNNMLFMADGVHMKKWTGTDYSNWGIAKQDAGEDWSASPTGIASPTTPLALGYHTSKRLRWPNNNPPLRSQRTYYATYTFVNGEGKETNAAPVVGPIIIPADEYYYGGDRKWYFTRNLTVRFSVKKPLINQLIPENNIPGYKASPVTGQPFEVQTESAPDNPWPEGAVGINLYLGSTQSNLKRVNNIPLNLAPSLVTGQQFDRRPGFTTLTTVPEYPKITYPSPVLDDNPRFYQPWDAINNNPINNSFMRACESPATAVGNIMIASVLNPTDSVPFIYSTRYRVSRGTLDIPHPFISLPTSMSVNWWAEFIVMECGLNTDIRYRAESPPATNETAGAVSTVPGGDLILHTGRSYRYAYANSITGHVGAASAPSGMSGTVDHQGIVMTIPAPSDPQVDSVFLFSTKDGGADYYMNPNPDTADGSWPISTQAITIIDMTLDDDLDMTRIAPLINEPPPKGKYLTRFQGRILVAGLQDAPQDVAYSGYERILIGRPEESFPPNNRLRLAIGSDDIAGMGALSGGVVIFSRSNEMFFLRGSLEDITLDAPVAYSAFLEELRFNVGCASHWSIVSTPIGLVWLASDLTIKLWNGTGEPVTLSSLYHPVFRDVHRPALSNIRAAYWGHSRQSLYILALPTGDSPYPNKLLLVDLTQDETNFGCAPLDIGTVYALCVFEDANSERHIAVLRPRSSGSNGGALFELKTINDLVNGMEAP